MNQNEIVRRVIAEFPTINGMFLAGINVEQVVKRVVDLSREKAVEVVCEHCGQPEAEATEVCTNEDGHRWIRSDGRDLFDVKQQESLPTGEEPTRPLFMVVNTATGFVEPGDIYEERKIARRQADTYNQFGKTGKSQQV